MLFCPSLSQYSWVTITKISHLRGLGNVKLLRVLSPPMCFYQFSLFSLTFLLASPLEMSLNLWGEMYCSCVESCQSAEQDFVLEEWTILHMLLQHLLPIFLSFHHYSPLQVGFWILFYVLLSLLFSLFSCFFFLFWPFLHLSFSSPSLCPHSFCLSELSPSSSRHTGQIWIVLMYLNRHAQWEKPLLLTTACSQWADIGVSFCEWDRARAFRWDSWPGLPASSVLLSHTHTHNYLLSNDKPRQSLLGWFRCSGSLVTDIKVRIKHLPCYHLFHGWMKTISLSHSVYYILQPLHLTHSTMHST